MTTDSSSPPRWPELPTDTWWPTVSALHLWTQVVGKIRLTCGPWLNHSWGVALYVTARGLSTSLIAYDHRSVQIDFDLRDHRLQVDATDGATAAVDLETMSVADFHQRTLAAMDQVGLPVTINPQPSEIPGAVPFDRDTQERPYVAEHAQALWSALVAAHRVMSRFRAGYQGKASPVHLFWGAFDLAVTRFSGRTAPPHPGGLPHFPTDVAQEAYSHEVTSCGFWPGDEQTPTPVFYAYAYPTPDGFDRARGEPAEASWSDELGEFVLAYEAVRTAPDPDAALLGFFESTHGAAATLAGWDRDALECRAPMGPDWWRTR
jgi:hypothetical protein